MPYHCRPTSRAARLDDIGQASVAGGDCPSNRTPYEIEYTQLGRLQSPGVDRLKGGFSGMSGESFARRRGIRAPEVVWRYGVVGL